MDPGDELQENLRTLRDTKAEPSDAASKIACLAIDSTRLSDFGTSSQVKIGYLNLCQPAYDFVMCLKRHDGLDSLGRVGGLVPLTYASEFPYEIPAMRRRLNPHEPCTWNPARTTGAKTDIQGGAWILLWLAAANSPTEFDRSQDLVQYLLGWLPLGRDSKTSDLCRYGGVSSWAHRAATAIVQDFLSAECPSTDGVSAQSQVEEPIPTLKSGRVTLFDQNDRPHIDGKSKERLTGPGFNVVSALIEAGKGGLTKDKLVNQSGHSDARAILDRLKKKDKDWDSVLIFPGVTAGGYRIL